MSLKKRKRGMNWSADMKEVLLELVKPCIDVLDSKLNNTQMIKKKKDLWGKIVADMAIAGYNNLSVKQVREQWIRSKTMARSRISNFKKEQMKTGGGSPPVTPEEIDYEIAAATEIDFQNDTSAFDSDKKGNLDSNKRENSDDDRFEHIIEDEGEKNMESDKSKCDENEPDCSAARPEKTASTEKPPSKPKAPLLHASKRVKRLTPSTLTSENIAKTYTASRGRSSTKFQNFKIKRGSANKKIKTYQFKNNIL